MKPKRVITIGELWSSPSLVYQGVLLGMLAFGLWAALHRLWPDALLQDGTLCPGCGYSLIGNTSEVCPECGRPFTYAELGTTREALLSRRTLSVDGQEKG